MYWNKTYTVFSLSNTLKVDSKVIWFSKFNLGLFNAYKLKDENFDLTAVFELHSPLKPLSVQIQEFSITNTMPQGSF